MKSNQQRSSLDSVTKSPLNNGAKTSGNKSKSPAITKSPALITKSRSVNTKSPNINKTPIANGSKSPVTINTNKSPAKSNSSKSPAPSNLSPASRSTAASSPTKSMGKDNDNMSTVDTNEMEVSKYQSVYTKNSLVPYSSIRTDDGHVDVNLDMTIITHMNNIYHFPIEFTCKDYMKKIFDIVLTGIRIKVIEVTKDKGLKPIDDNNDYKVSYLLKQIIDDTTVLSEQTTSHLHLFMELLSIEEDVSQDRFINTVTFLFELENVLPLIDIQAEYYDLVLLTFEHAQHILVCFSKPVAAWYTTKACEDLDLLLKQYTCHCKLKHSRIETYIATNQLNNNNSNPNTTSTVPTTTEGPEDEVDNDLLLQNIKQLTQEMHECMQPEDAAITKLVRRLLNYSTDITYFIQQSVKKANFKEVKMLKNLDIDIQYMLHLVKSHPIYGDGHHRLTSMQKLSDNAKLYLKQLSKAPDSHILSIQLEKSKQKLDALIHSYPFGVVVEYFMKVDHQLNLHNYLLVNPFRSESVLSLLRDSQSTGKKIMQYICYQWYGISYENMAVDELFEPPFLKTLGFSMIDLKSAGYSLVDLKNAGYVIFKSYADELKASTGMDLQKIKIGGSPKKAIQQLRAAGYTISSLRLAGYTAAELKEAGYNAVLLRDAEYSLMELKAAGYSTTALKQAGYTISEIKNA